MWIMTPAGFYSAVKHRHIPEHVMVRARARKDLENLMLVVDVLGRRDEVDGDIVDTSGWDPKTGWVADYPVRVTMSKALWAECLHVFAEGIDYDNFKTAVARTNRERAKTYHSVWAVLLNVEKEGTEEPAPFDWYDRWDDQDEYDADGELEDYDDGEDHREDDADIDYILRTQGPIGEHLADLHAKSRGH